MKAKVTNRSSDPNNASVAIDKIIASYKDWRGPKLSELRKVITKSDPTIIEEVKWKKPSNPDGIPVWSRGGIICFGNILKSSVRLTFPKGADINDDFKIFNTRLDSNAVRAIDFRAMDTINDKSLRFVILQTIGLNSLHLGKQ